MARRRARRPRGRATCRGSSLRRSPAPGCSRCSPTATGAGPQLHHDALLEGSLPFGAALALFVLAWQVMIAAMMLPSTLPMLRLVAVTAQRQPRPRRVLAAFVGGYALIWTLFGYAAFCGDALVHAVVDAVPWLSERPWLVAGATLVVAGAFQFSALKDRCLQQVPPPGARSCSRTTAAVRAGAFRLGRMHGLYCLGCCWALMLVMFAAGVATLWWMAALTALMVFEKTARAGERAVPVAGIALLAWGALVMLHPGWLPAPVQRPVVAAGELRARRRALALLAFALVLSMTTWFSATAVIPQLRAEWDLSTTSALVADDRRAARVRRRRAGLEPAQPQRRRRRRGS